MALTPFMNLNLPIVNVTSGPQFATLVNAAFSAIDSHDHTPNNGKQITTAGLFINADLDLHNNNLLNANSVTFNVLTQVTGTNSTLEVINGELNYVDSNGNQVQITSHGAINVSNLAGNISGMNGTTAAVTYNNTSKTFFFTRSSGVGANIQAGRSLLIQDSGSNTVSVQSPTTISSSYTLTLPTAQASVNYSYLQFDTSGNASFVQLALANLTYISLNQATGLFTLNQINPATDIQQASASVGQKLGWNGSGWAAVDTVSVSSQTSLANSGTISAGTDRRDLTITVAGASGAVTVTMASGLYNGQKVTLVGNDNTNTVALVQSSTMQINGNVTLAQYDTLNLTWNGSAWIELGRSN